LKKVDEKYSTVEYYYLYTLDIAS